MRFALELKHWNKESILPQLLVFYSSEERKCDQTFSFCRGVNFNCFLQVFSKTHCGLVAQSLRKIRLVLLGHTSINFIPDKSSKGNKEQSRETYQETINSIKKLAKGELSTLKQHSICCTASTSHSKANKFSVTAPNGLYNCSLNLPSNYRVIKE